MAVHKWTEEENQYIKDHYKELGKHRLCEIFNVSIQSMNHKYQRLGITEKSIMGQTYKWSEDDLKYLYENWMYKHDKDICKELGIDKLGFSHYVVTRKRIQLGLVGKSKRIRSNKDGYKYYIDYNKPIFTHRTKMEAKIGRKLKNGEIVHHIDGNKSNDDIENLYLCKNNSEHQLVHDSLSKVAFELVKTGIIKFDSAIGKYYL